MATINLGRVGFVNKGTYSGATAYKVNDVVTYNGGTYACVQAHTGQLPTATAYWQNWVSNDKVLDSAVVHNTGNETIAGVKTFSSSPIAPTPTAGDNSTKTATTSFVKTKGVEYTASITSATSYTLTANDIGKFIVVSNDTTNETVTLPSVASVPVGATLTIINVNTKGWYIKCNGAEQIYYGASLLNTIVLAGYNSFTCINRGDNWFVLGGGASSLGAGQGWINVTGNRALGTTYTNTTGKPIYVAVKYLAGGAGNYIYLTTAGIVIDQSNSSTASTIYAVGIIAPQGEYAAVGLGGALSAWYEFR